MPYPVAAVRGKNELDGLSSSIIYSLLDRFTTSAAAPLTSPRNCEPTGSIALVQTGATQFSISGGRLNLPGPVVANTTYFYSGAYARTPGLATAITLNRSATGSFHPAFGWVNTATNPSVSASWEMGLFASGSEWLTLPSSVSVSLTLVPGTDYRFVNVLRSVGSLQFVKVGNGVWKLYWVDVLSSAGTVYAEGYTRDVSSTADNLAVAQLLSAAFLSDYGLATLHVTSPAALAVQTATADLVLDITVTAPGTLANRGGIYYRDAAGDRQNCWHAYFDASGNFKLDSIASGTPTNRITVAGAIIGGGTRTIRIIAEGNNHDAYYLNGTTWAKAGATVTNNWQATATGVEADIGAGWSAANLISFPRTSSSYNLLDTI